MIILMILHMDGNIMLKIEMLSFLLLILNILCHFRGVPDVPSYISNVADVLDVVMYLMYLMYLMYQRCLRSVSDVPEMFVKWSEMNSEVLFLSLMSKMSDVYSCMLYQ